MYFTRVLEKKNTEIRTGLLGSNFLPYFSYDDRKKKKKKLKHQKGHIYVYICSWFCYMFLGALSWASQGRCHWEPELNRKEGKAICEVVRQEHQAERWKT